MSGYEKLLTAQQVADAANVSKQTVLNYAKEGIITPSLTLPSGQNYFDEKEIIIICELSLGRLYNDNLLVVIFGSESECRLLEKQYMYRMQDKNMQRIDNFIEYVQSYREVVRKGIKHNILLRLESIEKTIRLCEKKVHALERNNSYCEKAEQIERRYCYEDMQKLLKEIKNNLQDNTYVINYQPKTAVVKTIWSQVEQKYLVECTKAYLDKKLSKGYYSVLFVDCQNECGIYDLLHRAMDTTISRVEIYGYSNITYELQETIRYISEYKNVSVVNEEGVKSI